MTLNQYIDHTLLKPTATIADIKQLCKDAKQHKFFSVCVNSCHVALANAELTQSSTKVCSVVGFPLGAMSTKAKKAECKQAIKDGADEIDMVLNIGLLKSKAYDAVRQDILAVKEELPQLILKVILETCYLSDNEILRASELAIEAGADFIKTSTGFGTGGARIEHIKLMQEAAKNTQVKIKASGGIRDTKTALAYINIGVSRLGTSNGIAIVTGLNLNTSDY